ncbi:hypothetical protein GCM10007935_23500 [Hydrogenophaga electricum]|uniref:Uncharacterized protein n=1 Tax=Hydrogenophaga electricum TaxID=1230953 RepID=A0ABQ6C4T5_9BURK|nr:hypothetical protein GCM10007935_23500 [Hydrogenophaga electricum]
MRTLTQQEMADVAGGFFFCRPKCSPKPKCQPKPKCSPKPKCQPKPKCNPTPVPVEPVEPPEEY